VAGYVGFCPLYRSNGRGSDYFLCCVEYRPAKAEQRPAHSCGAGRFSQIAVIIPAADIVLAA
jgi:hypothetical protein